MIEKPPDACKDVIEPLRTTTTRLCLLKEFGLTTAPPRDLRNILTETRIPIATKMAFSGDST
jgi:hypothetical protein